ncbi:MAG: exodeoxyribonuclease VII small subunit [Oligoflexales bacterium]
MSEKEIDKESESYQNMMGEVENILSSLDQKDLDLDTMVERVERGYQLISNMKSRLEQTKQRVETLQIEWEQRDTEKDDLGSE